MARQRIKSLDEKYMGLEPDYRVEGPPTDDKERTVSLSKSLHWYSYYTNKKKYTKGVLDYCDKTLKYSKKEMKAMRKVPDWKLYMHCYAFIRLQDRGWDYSADQINEKHEYLKEMLEIGKKILKESKDSIKAKPKEPVMSPFERTKQKVLNTIAVDWDEMVVDKWMDNQFDKKEVKFPAYSLFQLHGLKGPAINMFKEIVEYEYLPLKDAYDKTCDQAEEAYGHIKKGDKKKMLVLMEGIFDDLERIRDSLRSVRTANKRPRSKDDQVKNLKYLIEDVDSKVTSINPSMIPTEGKLWIYNVKTRKLTEFTTSSTKGFEIRGSTLQNIDDKLSRITTLRKPLDILPQILNKTERQIDNIWNSFTTKIGKPTGRINKDTILLRVISYSR